MNVGSALLKRSFRNEAIKAARNYYVGPYGSPPLIHVPFWEKCAHFVWLNVAIFGYPAWVSYYSKYYMEKSGAWQPFATCDAE